MGDCSCSSKSHLRAKQLTQAVWATGVKSQRELWFWSSGPYGTVGKTEKRTTTWSVRSMCYDGNYVLPRLPQATSVHDWSCGILFIPLVEHVRCMRIATCEMVSSWRAGRMSCVFLDPLLLASSGTLQRLRIVFVEWISDTLISADNGATVGKPGKPGALRNFVMPL